MISQYGSYKNYLNSIEEEKKKVEQKKELEIKKVALDENSKKEEKKVNTGLIWSIIGAVIGILGIAISIYLYKLGKQ